VRTKVGSIVRPRYKGVAEWQVDKISEVLPPIEYADPVQGDVKYAPKIILLHNSQGDKVFWFAYWISTSKTKGNLEWGQRPPMVEENVLLKLLSQAIKQGFFTNDFLRDLNHELQSALK